MSDRITMEAELASLQSRRLAMSRHDAEYDRLGQQMRALRALLNQQDKLDEWSVVLSNRSTNAVARDIHRVGARPSQTPGRALSEK